MKPDIAEEFSNLIENFFQHYWHLSNPLIATHIQRTAKQIIGKSDLYFEEKQKANKLLLNRYEHWKHKVNEHIDPFSVAVKLAAIGNIIDYGAHSVPDQIERFINQQLKVPFAINHIELLRVAVRNANSILYLGDNAGEIVFDKLLIETMQHPNITYVVRNEPVINDVTLADAKMTGINKVCKVITNGSDAPSTLLEFCSKKFKQAFLKADIVISKGQGNFEGLMETNTKAIFFLLMAKCDPIAQLLGVNKGDMIAKFNQIEQCLTKLP